MTDLKAFERSLAGPEAPVGLSPALLALWWDGKDDWDAAHRAAQAGEDDASAWVHAYLHRKEGDLDNARYWYRRSGKPESHATLREEWQAIARALLEGRSKDRDR
jgi:hypothetical protein